MKIFNVTDYGAMGDGQTLNTEAIQKAIDACHQIGGGSVLLENGVFLTGSISLRDGVDLHIEQNAVLLGSPNIEDYPEREDVKHVETLLLPRWRNGALIFAEGCKNISITGRGTIDCNGGAFVELRETITDKTEWIYQRVDKPTPPRVVFLTGCRNVLIEDIVMINQPAGWSYWIHDCDYVNIDRITVDADVDYPNNDGIHINSSRHVTVSNCNITCGDDCIVVRANNVSLKENKFCEQVTVTNCNLTSYSSGVRVGWVQDGVIRNCTFSNLSIKNTSIGISVFLPHLVRTEADPAVSRMTGTSDVGRESTLIEYLTFNNIIMDQQYSYPVFIRIENDIPVSAVRNLYFSALRSRGPEFPYIEGRSDCHVKNISFSDCTFNLTDGSELGKRANHGYTALKDYELYHPMLFRYADNVTYNHTIFTNEQ